MRGFNLFKFVRLSEGEGVLRLAGRMWILKFGRTIFLLKLVYEKPICNIGQ